MSNNLKELTGTRVSGQLISLERDPQPECKYAKGLPKEVPKVPKIVECA